MDESAVPAAAVHTSVVLGSSRRFAGMAFRIGDLQSLHRTAAILAVPSIKLKMNRLRLRLRGGAGNCHFPEIGSPVGLPACARRYVPGAMGRCHCAWLVPRTGAFCPAGSNARVRH
ncbi:hypothetical protein [Xanthobacter agilis]|uniref:Uncharacterized protein n=1 Tax=Xanthobacter agilis TaxID=47492 RepID=A0ABU0L999_XANAG|nr:hypothetical protein [Xanthobacter agilis]MDQ0503640.1 hypothetical protein [Xanthobacter agilis]